MTTPRKIIQIAAIPETEDSCETIFALADDGTIWYCLPDSHKPAWNQIQLDSLPERKE
jgi:hypothetical protein